MIALSHPAANAVRRSGRRINWGLVAAVAANVGVWVGLARLVAGALS